MKSHLSLWSIKCTFSRTHSLHHCPPLPSPSLLFLPLLSPLSSTLVSFLHSLNSWLLSSPQRGGSSTPALMLTIQTCVFLFPHHSCSWEPSSHFQLLTQFLLSLYFCRFLHVLPLPTSQLFVGAIFSFCNCSLNSPSHFGFGGFACGSTFHKIAFFVEICPQFQVFTQFFLCVWFWRFCSRFHFPHHSCWWMNILWRCGFIFCCKSYLCRSIVCSFGFYLLSLCLVPPSSGSSFDDFGCVHLSGLKLVVCGLHWTSVCA